MPNLASVFFDGDAPSVDSSAFGSDSEATIYYLPGTTGWDEFGTNAGVRTVLWNPQIQTSEPAFGVRNDEFGFNITGTTGIPIMVEASVNLTNPVWTPLRTVNLTNGLFYFSEPLQTNNSGR